MGRTKKTGFLRDLERYSAWVVGLFILATTLPYADRWPWAVITLYAGLVALWILRRQLFGWSSRLLRRLWTRIRRRPQYQSVSLDTIAWDEFERLVAGVFERRGYAVELTKQSADQGIDVIAKKGKLRVGIQCKRYEGSVGNDAVHAAVAGSVFYNCNRTVVVSTSNFTRAAVEMADKAGVELWDRKRVESELSWL